MALETTASPGLTAEVREHYNKTLLYYAKPRLVHQQYAKHYQIPKGEGKIIHWRRFSRLPVATIPLTEGVTPAESALQVSELTVTVEQYGNWLGFSDRVSVQSIDPVLDANAEMLGFNSGETMDVLAREAYVVGTNVRYASTSGTILSRVTLATNDIINDTEIKKIRRTMARNLTPTFGDGTSGYYLAYVHPDTMMDLQNTDAFKNTGYYSDPQRIYEGTVMKLYGIMFSETTQAKVFTAAGASGQDIYATLVMGREAIGDVDISSLGLENLFKPLGSAGSADPLNQRQTQGWKATYAAKILNDSFLLRFEHSVTA